MEGETNKYERGKIYKITNEGYNECYIGSTVNKLSQRMSLHRETYKKWLETGKGLCTSFYLFNTYGVDNCKIELVEEIPCKNIHQLRQREGFYIRTTECVNKRMECKKTTPEEKEARAEQTQQRKEQRQQERKANLEQRKQKHQELRNQIMKELETTYNIDLTHPYINNNNENIEFDDNLLKQIKHEFRTRRIKPVTHRDVVKLYVTLINYSNKEKMIKSKQVKTKENRDAFVYILSARLNTKENRDQIQYIRTSTPQHMTISENKILENELDD